MLNKNVMATNNNTNNAECKRLTCLSQERLKTQREIIAVII